MRRGLSVVSVVLGLSIGPGPAGAQAPPPCQSQVAPPEPVDVAALLRRPGPTPFQTLLSDPTVAPLLARPGSAQPLPLPTPPPDLTADQRAHLEALAGDVAAAWARVVTQAGAELMRGAGPPPAPPAGLAPHHQQASIRYLQSLREVAIARLAEWRAAPTAALAWRWAPSADRWLFERAYRRYVAAVSAMRAGGGITFAGDRVTQIDRPGGTTIAPLYQGSELVGFRVTDVLGNVSYLRRRGDEWAIGTTWAGATTTVFRGSITIDLDGTIVRVSGSLRETQHVDGTSTFVDEAAGSTRVVDAQGRVVELGPTAQPARRYRFTYQGSTLVAYVDPFSGRTWTRAPGTDVWTSGTLTFRGEIVIQGNALLRIPTTPTTRFATTMRRLEILPGGGIRVREWLANGDSRISTDPAVLAFLEVLRARGAANQPVTVQLVPRRNAVPAAQLPAHLRAGSLTPGPQDGFTSLLRDHHLATGNADGSEPDFAGEVTLSSDSPVDHRTGALTPWYVFHTRTAIAERTITTTDVVTGQVTTTVLGEASFAFLRRRFDQLRANGTLPASTTFSAFVQQYRSERIARYRFMLDQTIEFLRVLQGDAATRALGYGGVPVAGPGGALLNALPGLMNQDRIFVQPANERRFRDRAHLLRQSLLANLPALARRLGLAEAGRFEDLERDEAGGEAGQIGTAELLGAFAELDRLLDVEGDQPPSIRVLAAIRHGAARSLRNLVTAPFTHPLETGAMLLASAVMPEAAMVVGVGMLIDSTQEGVRTGISMIQRGLDANDMNMVLQGVSRLSETATDLGVVAGMAALHRVAEPRPPVATPPNYGTMTQAQLLDVVTSRHPELARRLGPNPTRAQVEQVLRAWEAIARHPTALLSSTFQASLAEVRAAAGELARRNGWAPIDTRPIRTGVQLRNGFVLLPNNEAELIHATLDQLALANPGTYPVVVHAETGQLIFRAPNGTLHRLSVERLAQRIARDPALANAGTIYLGACFGGTTTATTQSLATRLAQLTGRPVIAPRGREFIGRGPDGRVYVQVLDAHGRPLPAGQAYTRVQPSGSQQNVGLAEAFGERVTYVTGTPPANVRLFARGGTTLDVIFADSYTIADLQFAAELALLDPTIPRQQIADRLFLEAQRVRLLTPATQRGAFDTALNEFARANLESEWTVARTPRPATQVAPPNFRGSGLSEAEYLERLRLFNDLERQFPGTRVDGATTQPGPAGLPHIHVGDGPAINIAGGLHDATPGTRLETVLNSYPREIADAIRRILARPPS